MGPWSFQPASGGLSWNLVIIKRFAIEGEQTMRIYRVKLVVVLMFSSLLISACASGSFNYQKPIENTEKKRTVVVNASKDELWKKLIPALGSTFFVINNLDKASGLINVSYSGDPTKYVDCGVITSEVKNLRGRRVYRFAGATPYQRYEILQRGYLYGFERTMKLMGRANILVVPVDSGRTSVAVNVKYVVTKRNIARNAYGHIIINHIQTIDFQSGSCDSFPGQPTVCCPKYTFEERIMELVRKSFPQ